MISIDYDNGWEGAMTINTYISGLCASAWYDTYEPRYLVVVQLCHESAYFWLGFPPVS